MFAAASDQIEPFRLNEKLLPLVEAVFDQFEEISFEDVCIIGAQHILPTTLQMLSSFFSRGLDPSNVFLIGKCYSTDSLTFNRLINLGVNVCPSSHFFKKGFSFDEMYRKHIDSFLLNVKKHLLKMNSKFNTFIILDDGGTLIRKATAILDEEGTRIIGIEQTSAGYEELKTLKLKFPVINVARSKAKLQYESPIIAKTLAQQLYSRLSKPKTCNKRMLIVGNGAIGKAIYQTLKDDFKAQFYDCVSSKSSIKHENLRKELSQFDLIIGCTGTAFLKIEDYKYLKQGAILISASSSDREFSAYELQQRHSGSLKCHDDFEVEGIKVINCGFPVNFGNDSSITDPPIFQFTRSLLTAAILTGIFKEYPCKLVPLDENLQDLIIEKFSEMKNALNSFLMKKMK